MWLSAVHGMQKSQSYLTSEFLLHLFLLDHCQGIVVILFAWQKQHAELCIPLCLTETCLRPVCLTLCGRNTAIDLCVSLFDRDTAIDLCHTLFGRDTAIDLCITFCLTEKQCHRRVLHFDRDTTIDLSITFCLTDKQCHRPVSYFDRDLYHTLTETVP